MDSNHDLVQTLRMFDGAYMNLAADEIERLRAQLADREAQSVRDAELEALRELQCCVESQIAQGNSVLAIEACIERLRALKSAPPQKPVSEDL